MNKPKKRVNPYSSGEPVTRPEAFFGREDVLTWMEAGLKAKQTLAMEGPYGMGKTSFLQQLPFRFGSRYVIAYVDGHSMNEKGMGLLLWQLASQIALCLGQEGPSKSEFEADEGFFRVTFFPKLLRALGKRQLVLAVDDLDAVPGEISLLVDYLVSTKGLSLVLAWERRPGGLSSEVLTWRLGPLTREATEELINQPGRRLEYDYEARERIFELTSGYPYFLQVLCHVLFERCASLGRVSLHDVEEVIYQVRGLAVPYMDHLRSTSSPAEGLLLAALATLHGAHGLVVREEVRYRLSRMRPRLSPQEMEEAFKGLVDRGLLVSLGPSSYRFQVDLLRLWLVREGPKDLAGLSPVYPSQRQRLLWPLGAAALVVALFLWSALSSLHSSEQGGSTPQGIRITPTASSVAGHPLPTATPSRPEIAYMFWDEEAESWDIYLMDVQGRNRTRLTDNPANDASPVWSNDGRYVYFVSDRDGNKEIYRMNRDGTNQINLTHNPAPDSAPSPSPDGSRIVFTSYRDGNWELYMMNSDGSQQARITFTDAGEYSPSWSPDGTEIAFVVDIEDNKDIYVMNADGTGLTQLTDNPATDTFPSWSPDGTKIAFESYRDGNMEIYLMNPDGSGQRNLTNNSYADDHGPSWSPDGTELAFYSNESGNWDIYTMDLASLEKTNISSSPTDEQAPAWRH